MRPRYRLALVAGTLAVVGAGTGVVAAERGSSPTGTDPPCTAAQGGQAAGLVVDGSGHYVCGRQVGPPRSAAPQGSGN